MSNETNKQAAAALPETANQSNVPDGGVTAGPSTSVQPTSGEAQGTPTKVVANTIKLFNPMSGEFPLSLMTRAMLNGGIIVTPPNPSGGDRTREDRERHKDRIRDQIKPQLPGIIGTTPIFGDGGKVKVPVKGGYEPKWQYGRDGKGGGGGSGKGDPSDQAGELIYVEISMEELIQMLFEEMELPDMLKKQLATTKVKTYKFRGVQPNGPKPRLRKNDTAKARIRRAIGMKNANPESYQHIKGHIPDIQEVPFHKQDERYNRVDETFDEDSKCVVFFVLDRSGSMGGDPLMIAKAYFLLNLMFLKTKYKDVTVVMIAHDAQAYRIRDEKKFYEIEVDGGTTFGPAYQMVWDIAQSEFPSDVWNRYMFHATDGVMFGEKSDMQAHYTKMVKGKFNFLGYLEIDPGLWAGSGGWQDGGKAILDLPEEIKKHVGMAKAKSLKDVPEAFKAILTKDKKA